MKKIFVSIIIAIPLFYSSQVAIGKNTTTNTSVSLEFGNEPKGIILPWATSENSVTGAVNGTFILDVAEKKVKVKLASGWKDLSVYNSNNAIDNSLQTNPQYPEKANAKATIGNPSSTPGILVLEDNNKAMILPLVENAHINIKSPAPGMMAYDPLTQQLAVYNGTKWTFWKPRN